jgi:methionine synthase II (cobalamin-independent)
MFVTSIGTLPLTDVRAAVDIVCEFCPEIPFWPQLPRRSFMEGMVAQCLENIPSVIIDENKEYVHIDSQATDGIEQFYDNVEKGNLDAFAITERAAPGLFALLDTLSSRAGTIAYIKGQLAGPFTIGLGVKDEKGKPIIYDSAYFDIVKKALNMKAKWIVKTIKDRFPDKKVILFFDEPAMVSFGSAYVSISRDEVTAIFNEVIDGLDALVGIHCCGNTDWPVILQSNVDVVNYDAFGYLDTIFYFRDILERFLVRGGRIFPGIVPSTSDGLSSAKLQGLVASWKRYEMLLADVAGSAQTESIVTTSCGLGSLSTDEAHKALQLLSGLKTSVTNSL